MNGYDELCLKVFLKNQEQLFDEPVAETLEEVEEFLEDCMAVVVDSIDEVREFFDEEGMDASGMSDEELDRAISLGMQGISWVTVPVVGTIIAVVDFVSALF